MIRSSARSLTALLLVALPVLTGAAPPPPQQVLVIDGRGHGHGVGMAQDSAFAMAAAGASHEQILNLFYPGTRRGVRGGTIRVAVWEADAPTGEVTLRLPGGGRVRGDSGSADARPGAVLRVYNDGSGYHVREVVAAPRAAALRAALVETPSPSPSASDEPVPGLIPSPSPSASPSTTPRPGTSASPAPEPGGPRPTRSGAPTSASPSPSGPQPLSLDSSGPVTFEPAGGGTTAVVTTGRAYRGTVTALAREGFRLVNAVDIEDYLRGLGEVPAGWPMAALRTQAVAARTYALRSVGGGQPLGYDICDDTRCQVYLGVTAESPRTTAAARETRGEVVTYRGALADTFYSANAGGVTATPAEGFGGSTTIPYLPGGTRAPGGLRPYTLTVSPQDVARRLGYGGRLDAVVISQKGPSGRATRLRLEGSAGVVEIPGITAQRRLGLRSNLFTVTRGTGKAQALPDPSAAATQLPPAQAARALAVPEPSPSPLVSPPPVQLAVAVADPRRDELPPAPVGVAGALVVLGLFGVVLGRRAQLTR